MSALTESEIFDCMAENLRLAAQDCELLATSPAKGFIYDRYRKELKLVEGACRQASAWREDARWLPIGLQMAECHKRAGEWLRGVVQPDGHRAPIPFGQKHPLFLRLSEVLRMLLAQVEALRTQATGRSGMILPGAAPLPFRETRQHQINLPAGLAQRASGLIVPGVCA